MRFDLSHSHDKEKLYQLARAMWESVGIRGEDYV